MQGLIVFREKSNRRPHVCVLNLKQAADKGMFGFSAMSSRETKKLETLASQAPNITLNVKGSTSSATELWFCAAIGVILQTAAMVVPGFMVYLWKWQKGGNDIAAYGYPSFIAGSVSVILGLIGCSHVIEASTTEKEFHVRSYLRPQIRRILRLQRSCTVG